MPSNIQSIPDFWCAKCGGPWIKPEPPTERSRFCSEECGRKANNQKDLGSKNRLARKRQPPPGSKYNCAICLYRLGFGYRTVGKRLKSASNLIRRWVILSGNERTIRDIRVQLRRLAFTRRRGFTWTEKRIHALILKNYRDELRAASMPEKTWSTHFKRRKERTQEDRDKETIRLLIDPIFRAKFYVRKRVKNFLKQRGWRKTASTSKAIGCSPEFLRNHLERQFRFGMSWKNHGLVWHIDHVKPLARAKSTAEVMKLTHWTNLQPLFIPENQAKGCKELVQVPLFSL